MSRLLVTIFILMIGSSSKAQSSFPWQNALIMVQSNDGISFNTPVVFQDSSGVPCVVRWNADTLVAVFQWFRQPMNGPTWDKVAVKFSPDGGITWSNPTPIVINNLPPTYQRPFDPTLVVTADRKLRIYYSSSDGMPVGGLTAIVNTYSAISSDGINYQFEPGARFDHPTTRVIDPAVAIFNNAWHYTSPIGAPQDGAYHCTSTDGLVFTQTTNINSDNQHNWTGNLLVDGSVLKFYGSGPSIWVNSSTDGNTWNGYVNTNIMGGDPGIVKTQSGKYLMIYVGPNPLTSSTNPSAVDAPVKIIPNPFVNTVRLNGLANRTYNYSIFSESGALISQGNFTGTKQLDTAGFPSGIYVMAIEDGKKIYGIRLVK